jgi:hypothetical protein
MNITQETGNYQNNKGESKNSPCIMHDKETLIQEQFERLDKAKSGLKYDQDKIRYDLYPLAAYEGCTKVLTFGAKKYAPNGWKSVPDAENRYYAALIRHLNAQKDYLDSGGVGLALDDESGLPHLDHAQCCLVFLREVSKNNLNNL